VDEWGEKHHLYVDKYKQPFPFFFFKKASAADCKDKQVNENVNCKQCCILSFELQSEEGKLSFQLLKHIKL